MKNNFYTVVILALFSLIAGLVQAQTWQNVGPIAFPTNISGQIHGIGRVSQVKFHATNANRMYAVSASGGLWISNDAGSTWSRTGSETQLPRTSCSAVCIDYTNDNIIYLSTGDANYYGNGYGIWKSTNGGTTWAQSNATIGNRMAVEILMSPSDHNTIIAATTDGIWKSTDAGATWTVKKTGGAFKDMVYRPGSSTVLYAVDNSTFWRSTDNGETWAQISSVAPAAGNGGRIGVTAANAQTVYVGFVGSNSGSSGGIIYRSTDGGATFTLRKGDTSPNLGGYSASEGGQGNYNFSIFADRANANTVYVGAHCNWKSTDGGATWTLLTNWYEKCHTDMHQVVSSPYNNSRLFNVNDGGIFLSTDGGSNWTPSANGLGATEIYHMGTSKLTSDIISIGTQDNGELYFNGTTWFCNRGGDWGSNATFDYANPNTVYYVENARRRNLVAGGGEAGIGLTSPNNNDKYALTSLNTNLAYVGQTTNLRRSSNLLNTTPTWTTIRTFTSNIGAICIAPNNVNEVYVVTRDAKVYYSTNANAASPTFTERSTLPNSTASFTNIVVTNNDPNIVYASAGSKIYRSSNKGSTWTDISGTLSNVNIIDVEHDIFTTNETVYIATALGVYSRTSTSGTWQNISAGLPTICNITNLRLFNNTAATQRLRVSFYGRGVWERIIGTGTNPCDVLIPRTQYSIHQFDSEQSPGDVATNAIDGNSATIWHTQWNPTSPAHPHYIAVNLGGNYSLGKVRYTPRPDPSVNGRINAYQIHVSTNGTTWTLAASGNFVNTAAAQDVIISGTPLARYVRLTATSEVNGNPWTSVGELAFYGCSAPGVQGSNEIVKPATIKMSDLKAYPVPSAGIITLNMPVMEGKTIIMDIIDTKGQSVHKERITPGTKNLDVDLKRFASGQYIVTLRDETGVSYSTKILKQ